ncbi:hypothetical protein BC829DRAFT_401820 [Chytridium lagenaria]|nr:hypothetical protein BC829DRAFT_401820 [Chytridium lagenaria]
MATTLEAAAAAPKLLKKRLQFLHDAAHLLYSTSPELSRHYMSNFALLSKRASEQTVDPLQISDKLVKKFCGICGSLFVPGQNCSVRIIPFRQSGPLSKRKRWYSLERDSDPFGVLKSEEEITEMLAGDGAIDDMSRTFRKRPKVVKEVRRRAIWLKLDADRNAKTTDLETPLGKRVVYLCHICDSETRLSGTRRSNLNTVQSRRLTSSSQSHLTPQAVTASLSRPPTQFVTKPTPLASSNLPMQALLAKKASSTRPTTFSIDDFLQ